MDVVDQDNPQPEAPALEESNPAASSSSEPEFEPLEGAELGGEADDGCPPDWEDLESPKPKVEPFTDDEIIDGTALITMLAGARITKTTLTGDADVVLYQQAYRNVFAPFVPTKAVIAPLHLGEALARYGIGKGMMPGSLDVLPPYLRLALGAAVLGMSSYMAFNAVKREQATKGSARGATEGAGQEKPKATEGDQRKSPRESARGKTHEEPQEDPNVDMDDGWRHPAGVST